MGPALNTPKIEDTADISADGRTIWLPQMSHPGWNGFSTLWQSHRVLKSASAKTASVPLDEFKETS
jgi:hypothetical protein